VKNSRATNPAPNGSRFSKQPTRFSQKGYHRATVDEIIASRTPARVQYTITSIIRNSSFTPLSRAQPAVRDGAAKTADNDMPTMEKLEAMVGCF
jgi:hypothetical protein